MDTFYSNIKTLLTNGPETKSSDIDESEMSKQQMQDIITCAASIFIRSDYSMNFKYTDLAKFMNYIGFESGVFCSYPNYINKGIIKQDFGCANPDFFNKEFGGYVEGQTIKSYDPRCRSWYKDQHKKWHSIFTDVYIFAAGRPGITNCVPLWSNNGGEEKYYGAYCLDQFPTAEDSKFVRKYYSTEDGKIVNYLIFNKNENTAGCVNKEES